MNIPEEHDRAAPPLPAFVDPAAADPLTRQDADRLARLQAVTASLSESLTAVEVAEVIVEQGIDALGAVAGAVALLTPDGAALEIVQSAGYPEEVTAPWRRFSLDAPVPLALAVRTGEPIYLETWESLAAEYPDLAQSIRPEARQESRVALPLLVKGRAIGGLALTFATTRAFDDDDRAFMLTLARHCAQALERARLYEEAARAREEAEAARRRMAFLAEASDALAASLDYETTLARLAHLAVPALADWCAVDMLETDGAVQRLAVVHIDPDKAEWGRELQRRYPPRPERGVGKVLRTGEPEFLPQITEETLLLAAQGDASLLEALRIIGFASYICVPLIARGRTLGAITLATTLESGRRFTAVDLVLAQDLARRAALAVDNALLYQRAEEERTGANTILESITDAFYALDSAWRYTYVNHQCERYYGKGRDELLGRVVWEVFPLALGTAFEREYRKVLREKTPSHFEVFSPLSLRWLDVHAYPSADGLSVYFRDITERKQAEEEILYVTTRARCLLWQGTVTKRAAWEDAVWDLRIFDETAAQAFLPLEQEPDESYTQALYRHTLPADKTHMDETAVRALTSGASEYAQEFRCQSQTGEIRWLHEHVSIEPLEAGQWRLVGVCTDITEQVSALEAMKESEQRFEIMANAAPVLIWMSGTDGKYTYFNQPWLQFTGRALQQEMGDGWADGVHPDDRDRCLDIYLSSFAAREPFEREYRLRRRDGEYRWLLDIGTPRFLPGGRFAGYIGSCIDVTERRLAEQAILEQEARQRVFLKDVLASVTEGRLRLVDNAEELPARLAPASETIDLTDATLRAMRRATQAAAVAQGLSPDRWQDLITAVGEAAMNAVVHAGGGAGRVCRGDNGIVQVWIEDWGGGIAMERLPRATLERGFTTAGSFGHGFWMILKTVDRVWLLTGPRGTTVVMEQEPTPPEPAWLLRGGGDVA